jgi:raffinose/stachyose/melibiose transport system substrate-binding protein
MIKTIISFVSAIILSVSFSAFSKTKVTWSMESNADRDPIFLEKLQNAYNSAQDKYELEIQFEPNETRIESLRTSMLAGMGPDIVETPGPSYVKEYQEAGMLENLDSYAAEFGWKDKLIPWAYSSGVFDGSLYAIPKTHESMVMLYNKTLFEENGWKVPTTLEELEDVAGKIKAKGMDVYTYGSSGWQPTHEHLVGIYLNNYAGPQAVYEAITGEREWTDPVFVEALELLKKHMVDEGWWSGSLENYYAIGWDDFHAQFATRGAAMMTIGTWTFQATSLGIGASDDEWGWAPLPSLSSNSTGPNFMIAIGTTMSVNAAAKNKDGAIDVLNWIMSNKDVVIDIASDFEFGEFVVPLLLDESDIPSSISPQVTSYLNEYARITGEGNYGYCTWTFWPAEPGVHIWKDMEVVWAGDISVEDFMSDHQKMWDKARKKNETLPVPLRD